MAQMGQYDQGAESRPREDFELMPDDFYVFDTVESDLKPTSNGNGTVLALTHVVIEPREFAGRKVWQNINVQNASTKAQEIGQRELANLKMAKGIRGTLADTVQLHGKPFGAKLIVEKGSAKPGGGVYKDRNAIFDTFPAAEVSARRVGQPAAAPAVGQVAPAGQPAANAPAPAPVPAAGGTTPPWMKAA